MDAALLGLRVVLALACVLGLIWFTGRRVQGTAAVRKQRTVPISVLGRQTLGKGAGVALVEVAGRVLLLGVGEQGVRVLTEVDVPVEPAPTSRAAEVREEIDLSTLAVVAAPTAVGDVDGEQADDHTVAAELEATDAVEVTGTTDATGAPGTTDTTEAASADAAPDEDGVPTPHADGTARLAALAGLAAGTSSAQAGALRGSVLSPDTWSRTVDVVQRRTARR